LSDREYDNAFASVIKNYSSSDFFKLLANKNKTKTIAIKPNIQTPKSKVYWDTLYIKRNYLGETPMRNAIEKGLTYTGKFCISLITR